MLEGYSYDLNLEFHSKIQYKYHKYRQFVYGMIVIRKLNLNGNYFNIRSRKEMPGFQPHPLSIQTASNPQGF